MPFFLYYVDKKVTICYNINKRGKNMKVKSFLLKTAPLLLMTATIFGLSSCSEKAETNTKNISGEFKNIEIVTDTSDVTIAPSSDDECKVVCTDSKKITHTAKVNDGALKISVNDSRHWFEKNFTPKLSVVLYLPEGEYEKLLVESDTGDLETEGKFKFDAVSTSNDTGDIKIDGITCTSLKIKLNTGEVSLKGVNAVGAIEVTTDTGNLEIKSTTAERIALTTDTGSVDVEGSKATELAIGTDTGRINLSRVFCTVLAAKSSTGKQTLTDVIAEGKFDLITSTGDIVFDKCDATSVFVKTSTGDVRGSFLTDKVIFADTGTGKVDVPKLTSGSRCEITTSTGDIKITIEE